MADALRNRCPQLRHTLTPPAPHPQSTRRLIVNADDFGRSSAINQAVIRAHQHGILTTASLMVAEPGAAEAVALARAHPTLGVGLHLSLAGGRSLLTPSRIPGLTRDGQQFEPHPARAGWRYFFSRHLHDQLRAEIHAQFNQFHSTGLKLDHVNGHLHFHLHPTIFDILMTDASQLGIRQFRLTHDPLGLNLRLARGRYPYRLSHACLFAWLSRRARNPLRQRQIHHTDHVFGLLQDGHVHQSFLSSLLQRLPPGNSELYSHPCPEQSPQELEALLSPAIGSLVRELNIQLIRYQDL